jgi:hypothetical protein
LEFVLYLILQNNLFFYSFLWENDFVDKFWFITLTPTPFPLEGTGAAERILYSRSGHFWQVYPLAGG